MILPIIVACAVICARAGMDNLTYILTGFSMGYIVKCVAIGLEEAIYEAVYKLMKEGRLGVELIDEDEDDEDK